MQGVPPKSFIYQYPTPSSHPALQNLHVVINLVDDKEDLDSQTKVYRCLILPEVSQINTELLPGKITIPESRLQGLLQNLTSTRDYHDYYQQQQGGGEPHLL
jgi:hypothetical protein